MVVEKERRESSDESDGAANYIHRSELTVDLAIVSLLYYNE